MRIDGKSLADEIIKKLKFEADKLKQAGKTPKIAIVTVGSEGAWKAYVAQKIKMADRLGIKKELIHLVKPQEQELLKLIEKLNNDTDTQGLIIQRPLEREISNEKVTKAVNPNKDIDGFRLDSRFESPLWLAVKYILEYLSQALEEINLLTFLRTRNIVVIGKGEAGGELIVNGLNELGFIPQIVDSKTGNPDDIIRNADIIISCVGKSRVVNSKNIKPDSILIGVGMFRGDDGKLHGDYEEDDIKNVASFYTPIPGGVGPLNVAFLYSNLLLASNSR